MINKNQIAGLPEKTPIDGWVLIQTAHRAQATTGSDYINWTGLDATGGVVRGSLFGTACLAGVLPEMMPNEVWEVTGAIGSGRYGLVVFCKHMSKITDEALVKEFISECAPSLPKEEIQKYIDALLGYAKSIKDPQLNKLSSTLWSYMEPFLWTTPAAKGNHEPYRGGLAKHTYDVLKLIDNPVLWQMGLDWDVLVFSALYHDLGKVKCYTDTISYITEGRLVPHSAMALELMSYAIASEGLFDINPKLLQHIRHCIMSHHGQWAEIVPMTREATVLHQMDMVASRLGHFEVVIKSGNVANDGWGPWDRVFEGAPYIPEMDVL